MSKMHNIDHYINLYQNYLDFKENKEFKDNFNYYAYPHVTLARGCANYLNRSVSSDTIKNIYNRTASIAITLSGLLHPSFAEKVEVLWYDPIATRTILWGSRKLERLVKPLASRTATTTPILSQVDRSIIAIFQHAYIVIKDVNTILDIPTYLHTFLNKVSKEESQGVETAPTTLVGKTIRWIRDELGELKNLVVYLITQIYLYISSTLKNIPLIEQPITLIEKSCKNVKSYLYQILVIGKEKLYSHAHHLIDKQEKALRKKAMPIAAEAVARKAFVFMVTLALTTTMSYAIYKLPEMALSHSNFEMTGKLTKAWTITGLFIGVTSTLPIIYGLPENYSENFDPEASTFKELRHLVSFQNLHKLINLIKGINRKGSVTI